MATESIPELILDEAYWRSLLNDVEAQAPDVREGSAHARAPGEARRRDDPSAHWEAAQRAFDAGQPIDVQVVGCNRGGLLIIWNGLRGFMPSSHIVGLAPQLGEDDRRAELGRRAGTCCPAKVIEIDRARGRFVVSERLANAAGARREQLLSQLAPGQVRAGTVTNVCSFGAFVDLGGIEGLLHISEISWGRVNHPADLLRVGQQVEVQIMTVNPEGSRIALSIKRLVPDPWATVEQRYSVGQLIEGVVTSVVNFGAFARLEDGLEGLIHISELAEGTFLHPRSVVSEGQTVRVFILNIDGAHRRLGLSLRRANGALPEAEATVPAQTGAQSDGP